TAQTAPPETPTGMDLEQVLPGFGTLAPAPAEEGEKGILERVGDLFAAPAEAKGGVSDKAIRDAQNATADNPRITEFSDKTGSRSNELSQFKDWVSGKSDYVSIAGTPDQFGRTGVLNGVVYNGKTYDNVPVRVDDHGDPRLFYGGQGNFNFDIANRGGGKMELGNARVALDPVGGAQPATMTAGAPPVTGYDETGVGAPLGPEGFAGQAQADQLGGGIGGGPIQPSDKNHKEAGDVENEVQPGAPWQGTVPLPSYPPTAVAWEHARARGGNFPFTASDDKGRTIAYPMGTEGPGIRVGGNREVGDRIGFDRAID